MDANSLLRSRVTVSIGEAARLLGRSTRSIHHYLADGVLRPVIVGRTQMVAVDSIRRMIEPSPAPSDQGEVR